MMQFHDNLILAFGSLFGALIIASLTSVFLKGRISQDSFIELQLRVKSWWVMVTVFVLALILSRNLSLVFFAFISFLAMKEFFSMVETRRADRRVLFWGYIAIPIQYYLISMEWYGLFIIFIPLYMSLLLPMRMIMIGETDGFIRSAGIIQWGLMKTVFCLSHIAALLILPLDANPNANGGVGLVLFLVVLTQLNDVAQFIWGKSFGKHKIVPKVSPGKTWEGLIGGVLTTTALAFLAASYLTPFTGTKAIVAGLLIGLGGFIGDVVMSAVKRDTGVKDSGALIPGHGGILDRVDSLTYTAPLFFHFVYFFHGPRIVF